METLGIGAPEIMIVAVVAAVLLILTRTPIGHVIDRLIDSIRGGHR